MADSRPVLKVSNVETYYGPIMAIRGVSLRGAAGRHRHHPGRQRRRQDHDPEDHLRRHRPAEGQRRRSRAARSSGLDPDQVVRLGHRATCPRAARSSRSSRCARTCAWAPTRARDPDGVARDLETVYGYFPVLRERAEQRAGSLSGGEQQMLAISRALMARPAADAARRALARPVAQAGQGDLRDHRAHQPRARRDHPAGRAERQHGAATADYGYVLEVGRIVMEDTCERLLREGRHQGVLPRHEGAERRAASGAGRRSKTWR